MYLTAFFAGRQVSGKIKSRSRQTCSEGGKYKERRLGGIVVIDELMQKSLIDTRAQYAITRYDLLIW
ncbi:MAG: hypothetical protein COT39_03230 [Parcubacteria group bacterium CG08_land_8_20_14_0_20_48_21]|nr:MAG: hypothetical protein AUK21_04445 [Parcubacteria group bacterium CG2_30_48_51]PIS32685.1 MAG: hypothetical protein COT39_03230 [Parcubacteria group bacterium CG08_land_8_20_14_0_20_48_21]PIW79026.1 MAG: hypothetical protein COZ99_03330 [Parcubacteria group bacterium CG_4_8_14_3_um_filter_48_16]PIZ77565.1 MAG: hypothetical protein COY03_02470 [bacterium CG_4_10_14_0_2_um_filter_48_144]PJE52637.1 MAG: hypothetical protein COV80_02990 [Parcubacteria group bacterium CG11_big_fil_rev_8_21_14_